MPLPIASSEWSASVYNWAVLLTTRGPDLDVKCRDAQLLATSCNILCGQHSCVRRRFIAIGLDLHSPRDTADGFAAAGITQISL